MIKTKYGNAVILSGKGCEKAFEEIINRPRPDYAKLQKDIHNFEKRLILRKKLVGIKK